MALRKLPLSVQSKFSASTQINTFKAAVEELVYNAFDADSTSIAVRIHIQENFIQVVDNGHGVAKNDFHQLGQRYFTSKYENPTAKTNPKYGYYGQTLANIIEASESVNITSRCEDSEDAWVKCFHKGKPKDSLTKSTRPSIGTTVEIIGFLYNMPIRRQTVKALQELQRIKVFLEQMSLVHCNTSISLRDNAENEIIFKIHKNRDIPQTLTSILGIEISDFQELQVEKNQYKVTAYIQKMSTESLGCQWIYLNKRVIDNSNLHKIVNQNLNKSKVSKKILKVKNHKNEEDKTMLNNKLPDYFICITCPHNDYDIISNPKQSILEFKNWNQVDKLLEKIILFFNGSINVGKKPEVPVEQNKNYGDDIDTRNQVKQIMNKILGGYQKQHNGSQLHNGVKGKIVKRKIKKNIKERTSKLKIMKENHNSIAEDEHGGLELVKQKDKPIEKNYSNDNATFKIPKIKPVQNEKAAQSNKQQNKCNTKAEKIKNHIAKRNPVITKFEKETDELKNRCQMLAKKAKKVLDFKKKRKCKIFTNEIIEYSTVITDKKSVSIRKKIDEVIIHEYLPLPQRKRKSNHDHVNDVMKSYDLIHPVATIVTKAHNNRPVPQKHMKAPPVYIHEINNPECDMNIPRLTYESHNYDKVAQRHQPKENDDHINAMIMSKSSPDNLPSPKKRRKEFLNNCHTNCKNSNKKYNLVTRKTKKYITGNMFTSVSQTSYSIHFTGTELQSGLDTNKHNIQPDTVGPINPNEDTHFGSNAITDSNKVPDSFDNTTIGSTECKEIPDLDEISQTSYSIHFTEKEMPSGLDKNHHNTPIQSAAVSITEIAEFGSTYTIIDSSKVLNNHDNTTIGTTGIEEISCVDGPGHMIASKASIHYYDSSKTTPDHLNLFNENVMTMENNNCNVVFVSNSQHLNDQLNANESIDPLRICETILEEQTSGEYNFIFDSVNNVLEANDCFQSPAKDYTNINNNHSEYNRGPGYDNHLKNGVQKIDTEMNLDLNMNFNIKNRRRFIPKGLSPIFENCNSKNVCDYEFEEDYFEENVYNNFAEDVHINTETFAPTIQNVKELVSKDIQRVNSKLSKQNACLTFNGDALKEAQVLGQVDHKFIATKIKNGNGKYYHLVLFDQHAVHERIRLETNMAEYLKGGQWKSATLDGISLHLSKEDILYLHNCKDKFYRLGLEWNIQNGSEVVVTAIPEAILGKHVRQVDIVLKAVKSLIKEVIIMIKEQGGCVSVYPKSIMDLVFSEACRYAIMFGDALSNDECSNLLNALSKCKTPFQCAHGRPVMAVLMDINAEKRPYKVNLVKIQQFRRMQKLNK